MGPLAGIQSALEIATSPQLLILPCDTPLVSAELLAHLLTQAALKPQAITLGQLQP